MKAARGIMVDDEQFFALRDTLGERAARYHGFREDFLDGDGGRVVIWPADRELASALSAMKDEGISPPKVVSGYEAEYISRKAAILRGLPRAKFSGHWGYCLGRPATCAGHAPLGFFTMKKDAAISEAAAKQICAVDPKYRPEKMETGGEDDDGEEPIRPNAQKAFARGVKLAEREKHAEARRVFQEVVALEPSFEPGHEYASLMSRELGDLDAMLESSLARCKLFPKSADAWMDVSIARQNLGEHRRALTAIERAIELDSANGTLEYQRACVLAVAGKSAESLRAIAKALKMDSALADDIREDDDFESLRATAAFQKLVGRRKRSR